ncbi:D-alanyl-D-alanine carboxypeptidase/D-alanyl-D-alanine-endopeptidase [Thioclava sp. SK-1]|uniref:D-alanyl-D-alanine carboxypeptidase/D-alanyl-D-alanine endopeptidase n=1 Tax=Thioclava sp. SK-1 TaxID=1889770 RepID=UPI00082559D6|nr:D-alanyl-D-alanine carboxypeptidase/D-alanyl-D-alanine-endopeptidase [Thioclava sp. SK-1]OCX64495.1 D-alanyl-D-alanine carboxypeptidase/D-alanyl-D-alanine-endopeptidase [Thioclava sp. SK-1]
MRYSRRVFLTTLSATALCAATPSFGVTRAVSSLIAAANLGGDVSFVVADARTGQVLESSNAGKPMAPASTAKALTSIYALETLGPDFRFLTRLVATGPVVNGVIQGDLILAGGADPTLSTDDLGAMAAELTSTGVRGITGKFLIWAGAIPYAAQIDRDQPEYVGYNPAISGMILNYNRVHFEWKRAGSGWAVGMDARAKRYVPRAYTMTMSVANRDAPLFSYSDRGGKENWTVARSALGRGGSRWLPVRHPETYAADVFQTLARAQGCPLPTPEVVRNMPGGTVLASHVSDKLPVILADMLKYSTNITAEAVGMTASAMLGANARLGRSAGVMSDWLSQRAGVGSAALVDHSGLGGDGRISAMDMVQVLLRLGQQRGLRSLMKPVKLRDETGKFRQSQSLKIDAKTGTLNFVSTLAGYMTAADGRELVFAIFTGDLRRRAQAKKVDKPQGSTAWVRRSKILQSQLLERWGTL